jgi:tetratricopeptide (TPR) repeat protein
MNWRVLITCLVIGGCASVQHPSGGSKGVGWREVTTPHFTLRTDVDAATATRAGAALEATRDALRSAGWSIPELPEYDRTEVYIVADDSEFERYFGPEAGVFVHGSPPAFFLHGSPDRWELGRGPSADAGSVLRREMAHYLSALVYQHPPRWFSAGLSEFLEMVRYSDDPSSVLLGGANSDALRKYRAGPAVPASRVLAWGEKPGAVASQSEIAGFLGTSWLLVHWFYDTRGEAFARYRDELARGTESAAAWGIAFPGLEPSSLDREIAAYGERGQYKEFFAPFLPSQPSIELRTLSPADIHVSRARIALAAAARTATPGPLVDEFKTEVDSAIALDASNVTALAMQTWTPAVERIGRVRQAATVHPRDPRVWRLLGDLLADSEPLAIERENAYRRAVALAPTNPRILNVLARLLLEKHLAAEALPLASRAAKWAPLSPEMVDTYAMALFQSGQCKDAIAVKLRVMGLLSDSIRGTREYAHYEHQLSEYQAQCRQAGPQP